MTGETKFSARSWYSLVNQNAGRLIDNLRLLWIACCKIFVLDTNVYLTKMSDKEAGPGHANRCRVTLEES